MQSTVRKTISGIFAKSLMVFLVITFGVWGIGDVLRGGASPNALLSVGDNVITSQDLAREMQQFQRSEGSSIPPEILNSPAFRQEILKRIVARRLTENAAKDAGFASSIEMVAQYTRENPMFIGANGKFSAQAFQSYLRDTQQSEAIYRQYVSKEALDDMYMSSADLDQITLPESYVQLHAIFRAEKRRATLISYSAQDAAIADEAALVAFYDTQKDALYMQPEKRKLQYGVITKASIDKAVAGDTSGSALEELGYAIDDAVAAGKSMQAALKDAALDAEVRTLDISEASNGKNVLEEAVISQGFALNEGEASGLMSDENGTYFVVSVVDIEEAEPLPFARVKDDVAKRYKSEQGTSLARDKANELKALLNDEDTIEEQLKIAKEQGATLRETGLLPRPEVSTSKDVPTPLLRGIFDAEVGDVIGPVALADGGYALAILTGVDVPKEPKAADATERLKLTAELSGQLYTLWAEAVASRYPVRQLSTFSAPLQE